MAEMSAGTIFAVDYRIERALSRGGMGEVYVARQLSTGRDRALKVMLPSLVENEEHRRRFTQEARIGASIDSEHVVEVVGAGVDAATGSPWLAMELLEGEDLHHRLQRDGALGRAEAFRVLEQLCHAVGKAHEKGIVHRDLKPENLFVARSRRSAGDDTVKVLDFGIAKLLDQARTSTTGAMGTPMWMAPEQTQPGAGISATADVWAIGLIAFRVLSGARYWLSAGDANASPMMLLREVIMDPMPSASARAAQIGARPLPEGFDAWFAKATDREPKQRFPNATVALDGLRAVLGDGPRAVGDGSRAVLGDGPRAVGDGARAVGDTDAVDVEPRAELSSDGPSWSVEPLASAPTERAVTPGRVSTPVTVTVAAEPERSGTEIIGSRSAPVVEVRGEPAPTRSRNNLAWIGGGAVLAAGVAIALVVSSASGSKGGVANGAREVSERSSGALRVSSSDVPPRTEVDQAPVRALSSVAPSASANANAIAPDPEVLGPLHMTDAYSAVLGADRSYKPGEMGEVVAVISARGDYHINPEYKFKMAMDAPPPGVAFRTTVTDVARTEKRATIRIPFMASDAGAFVVKGKCSLSVCIDAQCVVDVVEIEVPVHVDGAAPATSATPNVGSTETAAPLTYGTPNPFTGGRTVIEPPGTGTPGPPPPPPVSKKGSSAKPPAPPAPPQRPPNGDVYE